VSLCDYLVYGVATLNTDTWTLQSKDTYTDFQLSGINNATGLKDKNPQLKVEYSLGSWFVEESLYRMAADAEKRKLFINSCVAFLTEHNFDGLHLHWGNKGANVSENTDTDKKTSHITSQGYEGGVHEVRTHPYSEYLASSA